MVGEHGLLSLTENAATIGDYLIGKLKGFSEIKEVRGIGLMIGIELDRPCGELVARALDAGLLINVTADKVVRLLPALTFSPDEGRELVARLSLLIRSFLAS